MTASSDPVIYAAPKAFWQPSQRLVKGLYYGALSLLLVLFAVSVVFDYRFLDGITPIIGHNFETQLFPLLMLGFILKDRLLGSVWNGISKAAMLNNILVRSIIYVLIFQLVLVLPTLRNVFLADCGKEDWAMEVMAMMTPILYSVVIAYAFIRLGSWKKRHLGFSLFCLVGLTSLGLRIILTGLWFIPLKAIPIKNATAATQQLLEKEQFDPNRVFLTNDIPYAGYFTGYLWEAVLVHPAFNNNGGLLHSLLSGVLAHELGHRANNDILKKHVGDAVSQLLEWTVAFYFVAPNPEIYAAFGFETEPAIGALAITKALSAVAERLFAPVKNYLVRQMEYAADQYAVSAGHGKELLQFLPVAFPHNKSSTFTEWMYLSHPTTPKRVEAIQKAMGINSTPSTDK